MSISYEDAFQIFRETGALNEGHFLLTSGRHSDTFFLMPHMFQHPEQTERICGALAQLYAQDPIDTVIGPATGGIILAYEMARQLGRLGSGRAPRAIFTEKTLEGGMALKRQWNLQPGERVLVVEDAITTGGSVFRLMEAISPLQPAVVGVACIADRSAGKVDFGVPLRALVSLNVVSWLPQECPMCRQGIELVRPKG